MQIPGNEADLIKFARELTDQCLVSRDTRRLQYAMWRRLYYLGSETSAPSKHNRCYSHVDKLTSFLFSPADLQFDIELDNGSTSGWESKLYSASRYLNKRFNKQNCGFAFSQANEAALVDGASIVKLNWGPRGLEPWVIRGDFFGVLREDIADLNRQEAFTHTYYVIPSVFERMLGNRPDKKELIARVKATAAPPPMSELQDSYFHSMVLGGNQPISTTGTPSGAYGQVSVVAPQMPQLAPDVITDMVEIRDLWVWDDDREDWTTIRIAEPDIIVEGKFRHRNLSDIKGFQPFFRVCSNEVINYFWGRSELATVAESQKLLNRRVDDIDSIFRLQAKPPRSMSGFTGITEEKARILLSAGGTLVDGNPGAKVENLAPDMPANSLDYLNMLDSWFDDAAGFTNILSGQGEPGIRAGVHAGTLLRTSSARLRDRALLMEKQCADYGNGALTILRAKDATIITTDDSQSFTLDLLPADASATVDSHSSSPAFSEENKQMFFALAKAGVIDGEDLIEGVQPPRQDILISRYRQRQAAQAAAAAANPEILQQMQGKKKS